MGGESEGCTFPGAQREQRCPGPWPRGTHFPPPSESCSQAIFIPAEKGSFPPHPLRCGLLEEKACRALPPTGDTLTAKPPPNIRHPRIKPSRKPQKVQETQCRKTRKGVGQAFLPPLGRQIHRRQVSWAEPEISGSLSLMPQLHSELHMPGLGGTAVICTDTATAFMELIT